MQSSVITFTKEEERGACVAALPQDWSLCDNTSGQDTKTPRRTHLVCVCVCLKKRERKAASQSPSSITHSRAGAGGRDKQTKRLIFIPPMSWWNACRCLSATNSEWKLGLASGDFLPQTDNKCTSFYFPWRAAVNMMVGGFGDWHA